MKSVKEADVQNKKVFLRADYNVTIENNKILDDYRITASYPTLDYLLQNGALKITIGTHLGRPEGKIVPEFSTKPIADFLGQKYPTDKVIVLENLRFDSSEEKNDSDFAKKLADGNDIFVNNAFAVCHREAASTCAITQFLPSYAGFLIEKEMSELAKLDNPEKPFVAIIAGAKIETKLPLIEKFSKIADYVLVGGLIAIQAIDQKINLPPNVILPIDGINNEKNIARDIGPQTIEKFSQIIQTAKTVFWNGNLGMTEDEKYRVGSIKIAGAIINSKAEIKIVGGGDTVSFLHELNLADQFSFISTGGGATLEFLVGEKMPCLEALNAHHH